MPVNSLFSLSKNIPKGERKLTDVNNWAKYTLPIVVSLQQRKGRDSALQGTMTRVVPKSEISRSYPGESHNINIH